MENRLTGARVTRHTPVRVKAARLLDLLLGDWWAPSRRVAAGVLALIIVLLGVISYTLGPVVGALVIGALVVIRLLCRCP